MEERLQKVLAGAGIGSRRTCEEWIKAGRVRVDGQIVTELGTKVDIEKQRVTFDGRLIAQPKRRYYIALNKPRGVVCSREDVHAGRLVTELVDLQSRPMLRPVGRLDQESEGLIFLTDDGDFLFKLTHPKHHVPKTYRASVTGVPDVSALEKLATGVELEDGKTRPAENVRVKRATREADGAGRADIELTIYEGRNRQVRRMLSAVGHPVHKLVRVQIGDVRLSGLPSGAWRHLTPDEIKSLTNFKQQEKTQWQTAPSPLIPRKAPSRPNSSRATRPSRPPTSSNLPKKASTTG